MTAPARLDGGAPDGASVAAENIRVPVNNSMADVMLELWPRPAEGGVLRDRTDTFPEADAHRLAAELLEEVRRLNERLLD
ncbi:hypothetical protein [Streptomyces diastatochromogenes]|uniref:hypothetical protein n=1 Tax=Streptomyces diastatochromogenes TaxID=42236 RepID=UPI0036CED8DA